MAVAWGRRRRAAWHGVFGDFLWRRRCRRWGFLEGRIEGLRAGRERDNVAVGIVGQGLSRAGNRDLARPSSLAFLRLRLRLRECHGDGCPRDAGGWMELDGEEEEEEERVGG